MNIINNFHIIFLLFFINSINCISEFNYDENNYDYDEDVKCDENVEKVNNLFEALKEMDPKTVLLIMQNLESLEKHLKKLIEEIVDKKLKEKMEIIEEIVENKLTKSSENYQDETDKEYFEENIRSFNVNVTKCPNKTSLNSSQDNNDFSYKIYNITIPPLGPKTFPVVCDLETLEGGWIIIQRRQDGSENFNRNWNDYVKGFGDLRGEFFIGLKKLYALTTLMEPHELYIILEDFEGNKAYARYGEFKVDAESTGFKLTVGQYSGNAGDSLTQHNGYKFSTYDRDNDETLGNCAKYYKGGWWYVKCYYCNLNGQYLKDGKKSGGISWSKFRGLDYSLKFVQMMIRPKKV